MKTTPDNYSIKDGIIGIEEHGHRHTLSYVFNFSGHTFCPATGKYNGLPKEVIDKHNSALSSAEIANLDNYCEIGQQGTFYYSEQTKSVNTWNGEVVSTDITVFKQRIVFHRNGKSYEGTLHKEEDCFSFTRIS